MCVLSVKRNTHQIIGMPSFSHSMIKRLFFAWFWLEISACRPIIQTGIFFSWTCLLLVTYTQTETQRYDWLPAPKFVQESQPNPQEIWWSKDWRWHFLSYEMIMNLISLCPQTQSSSWTTQANQLCQRGGKEWLLRQTAHPIISIPDHQWSLELTDEMWGWWEVKGDHHHLFNSCNLVHVPILRGRKSVSVTWSHTQVTWLISPK